MPRNRPATVDEKHIRRCITLARRAEGLTSPNPMVGALIAKGGRVIAEAYHHGAGGAHAEASALRRAGPRAHGATLYVNLEPCCHFGRTPPCVDAIISSGVRRVVASHMDPFPLVSGGGFAALRRAGVEVRSGVLRSEAVNLNERYLTFVSKRRPFVIVKAAMTLDGKIATAGGESKWISSPSSRREAQRLRASCDAVLIGSATASQDDPLLTARVGRNRRQPLRVVLDGRLRFSPRARMLATPAGRNGGPILIYTRAPVPGRRAAALRLKGAEVIPVAVASGHPSLPAVLADLARRGVTSVLVEGGGEMIWSALAAAVVDRVVLFIAPVLAGGRTAIPVAGGSGARRLSDAVRLRDLTVSRIGPDLRIEARVATRRR